MTHPITCREKIERICPICGRKFITAKNYLKRGRGKYCSLSCAGKIGRLKLKQIKPQNGKDNPNWRGGVTKCTKGYIMVYAPKHPYATKSGYIMEHRLVMEKYLGRYLKPYEVVHHIDGDITNNSIENLKLFSDTSEHTKFHAEQRASS